MVSDSSSFRSTLDRRHTPAKPLCDAATRERGEGVCVWERECVCESESERERERDRERDRERESNTHTHAHTHTHTHTRTRIHTQSKSKHTPTKFLRSKESKQDSKVKTRWEQRGNAETLPPPLSRDKASTATYRRRMIQRPRKHFCVLKRLAVSLMRHSGSFHFE